MPVFTEVVARALYGWLLLFAMFVAGKALYKSPVLNKLRFVADHVYFAYVLVLLLSIVQIFQCAALLFGPLPTTLWWLPLFCKQMSLLLYLAVIDCVSGCGGSRRRES